LAGILYKFVLGLILKLTNNNMKKLLILSLFISLVVVSGCAAKKTDRANEANRQDSNSAKEAGTKTRVVAKDSFSFEAPANWQESSVMVPGVSLMMINSTETSDRPEVNRVNFKSYFSVSYDQLKDRTLTDYKAFLKTELSSMIAGISFQDLEDITVADRPAQVFSSDLNQQGLDFKLLTFLIAGKDQDLWAISFNTLSEDFAGYEELFFQIAKSFVAK
jgi:hypothetical protein